MSDETKSDSGSSMDASDVRQYHSRLGDALSPLGDLDGNPTLLINDNIGWYVTRANQGGDHNSDEYPKERRARQFHNDFNKVAATKVERTLYGLTSYKFPDVFEEWKAARYQSEDGNSGKYVYADRKPSPLPTDIAAISVWGDIDLEDDLKGQRPDLDDDTYKIAEKGYDAYVEAFADLYGGRDAVYMLDSVGGAYIFGAPEATLPISHYYEDDADARERVFSELIDRSNEYLSTAEEQINDEIDDVETVIHPDWANNINRQYKLPLTLHGDHDAVVTPVDVENVQYREPVPVDAVDDELLGEINEWCTEFTEIEYEDRVANLISKLWSEEFEDHGNWKGALDAWIEAERKKEKREEQRRQAAAQRREQRLEELADEQGIEGQPITPFLQDVYDALDGIQTAEIIRQYASDEWDSGADMPNKTEFNPSWRHSKSGRSCYVNHETNRFGDPGVNGGGYAAKAMALGELILTDASQNLTGEDWSDAVNALRDAGYEIPIWTPEKGSHRRDGSTYDQMPYWAMRKAAVALGVLPQSAFETKTNDDGEEYLTFPGAETYDTALESIEEVGLEHGRDSSSSDEPAWLSNPPETDVEQPERPVLTDEQLLEKARKASNNEKFERYWDGDWNERDTAAEADIALNLMLAFWSSGNIEQMDRLFRQSGLMRERWDEPATTSTDDLTYGEAAIRQAIDQVDDFYEAPPTDETEDSTETPEASTPNETDETDQSIMTGSGPGTETAGTGDITAASQNSAAAPSDSSNPNPTTSEVATDTPPSDDAETSLKRRNAELKEHVKTLKNEIEGKESKIKSLESDQAIYKDKIEYLQEEVEELQTKNENLQQQVDRVKSKSENLKEATSSPTPMSESGSKSPSQLNGSAETESQQKSKPTPLADSQQESNTETKNGSQNSALSRIRKMFNSD